LPKAAEQFSRPRQILYVLNARACPLPDNQRIVRLEAVRLRILSAVRPEMTRATEDLNNHLRQVMSAN
jgi:hypothetical protein